MRERVKTESPSVELGGVGLGTVGLVSDIPEKNIKFSQMRDAQLTLINVILIESRSDNLSPAQTFTRAVAPTEEETCLAFPQLAKLPVIGTMCGQFTYLQVWSILLQVA